MSYVLGFQTKYICNPWDIPVHPVQLVLLYLSILLNSWLAHCELLSSLYLTLKNPWYLGHLETVGGLNPPPFKFGLLSFFFDFSDNYIMYWWSPNNIFTSKLIFSSKICPSSYSKGGRFHPPRFLDYLWAKIRGAVSAPPHGFIIYKETKISKFFKNFTITPLIFLLLNYFKHEKRNLHGCVTCYMFAM